MKQTRVKIIFLQKRICQFLIETEFFIPEDWDIPRLNFESYVPELDHQWHQYESIELSLESPTDRRDLNEFLEMISRR